MENISSSYVKCWQASTLRDCSIFAVDVAVGKGDMKTERDGGLKMCINLRHTHWKMCVEFNTCYA